MVEKKKGTLDSLDKLTPKDWKKAQKTAEETESKSDVWLKALIDQHDKKALSKIKGGGGIEL